MHGKHRVLIAAQPSAWAVLKAMLGDLADLFPAHTTADAFKILERERIDLIVCTIAFDESQMMQYQSSGPSRRAAFHFSAHASCLASFAIV
jgi:hypothetical protein